MAKVTLTWTASPDPVDGYRLTRKVGVSPFTPLADVTECTYVDETVEENTNYQYSVQPFKGSKVGNAVTVTVQVATAPAPAPVTNLQAVISY